jgi:hypothetical protein
MPDMIPNPLRTPKADTFSLANYGINQLGVDKVQDTLADHVSKRFDEAVMHKRQTGIEEILLRNLRANKCEYQPDERALLGPFNDVYIGVSALKARAAESWLNDIILNNIDRPWTLDPTPQPDLPKGLQEQVVNIVMSEIPDINSIDALRSRIRDLKGAVNAIAFAQAEQATGRMETLIADQMAEGDWTQTFAAFIPDLCAYPTAIIRGPVVVGRQQGSWDGNKYEVKTKPTPTCRGVSPFDAFPSPTSRSTQDGEYFIERARYSLGDVHALIGASGFSEPNIREVLERYKDGFKLNMMLDTERDALEDRQQGVLNESRLLDTIIYNGVVPGELLRDSGILIPDYQKHYEVEVWVIGAYTIRAILNPNPLGKRPLYGTSFRKIPGSFWGQSVICLTYDTNRVCNASARSLVRNMSYSSGPIGEVVSERVADTEDPTDIRPYKVALVGPDMTGTGAPAYRFHNIESVTPDLIAVFERYMKIADDLSGIPAYVLGNPNVAGAGRTMGGLAMLMGNAAKGIKNVQLNIDRDVISGLVAGFYVYNMQTSKDISVKADCNVVARGATGLLQRELAQTRTVELLQLLTPYIENWEQLPDGIKVLLREVLKSTGLPIDDIIPDPNKAEANLALARLVAPGAATGPGQPMGVEATMNRGTGNPVPLPPQSVPQGATASPLSARPAVVNMPQGA